MIYPNQIPPVQTNDYSSALNFGQQNVNPFSVAGVTQPSGQPIPLNAANTNLPLGNTIGTVSPAAVGYNPVSGLDFNAAPAPAASPDFFSQQNLFGGTDASGLQTQGIVAPTLGAASGLAQTWLGFQNLGLAKENLAFQKDAFSKQFENQRSLTNQNIADRERSRGAFSGRAQSETDKEIKRRQI